MEDGNVSAPADDVQPQGNDATHDNERLDGIKSRALEELLVLLPEADSLDAEKRFEIYINDLHEKGIVSSAESALDAALAIEDHSTKANALSELVDEIDYYELSRNQQR
jgi:hypothetical protein